MQELNISATERELLENYRDISGLDFSFIKLAADDEYCEHVGAFTASGKTVKYECYCIKCGASIDEPIFAILNELFGKWFVVKKWDVH